MHVLIIGSLSGPLGQAASMARSRGIQLEQADDIVQALDQLRSDGRHDLVLCELSRDIVRLLESMNSERIRVPVVACGPNEEANLAVLAIKAGARDFLPLPPDADLIAAMLTAISSNSDAPVFSDPAMTVMIRRVDQIAPSDATVLITGESGTGKEVMAHYIHRKSQRHGKAFVALNCAAIPEALMESELFGHEKGAFSGAVARRVGKFEAAHGGTLLLDEIGELDARLQAKLLRAIQEREIDRVGGSHPVKVDVRIIATTNRDLQREVRLGNFRADLFFRLNVISLKMPPLRERTAALGELAGFFARKYAELNGRRCTDVSADALAILEGHSWPGNVRELENVMHRAVLTAVGDSITAAAIELDEPEVMIGSDELMSLQSSAVADEAHEGELAGRPVMGDPTTPITAMVGRTIESVEKDLIIETLCRCLGKRSEAAGVLGISIRTLRNKLHDYEKNGTRIPRPVVVGLA
jgi:DNA-binding NtrC family response regulator